MPSKMVLKIHGSVQSTCTNRVRTVCEELGIAYDVVAIDFSKGEHKAPAFLAIQPFGQVPYIDDDGFILFESRAIARYLAAKHPGPPLLPPASDLHASARFEQAASVEQADFDPYAGCLVAETVFKRWRGVPPDEARVREALGERLDPGVARDARLVRPALESAVRCSTCAGRAWWDMEEFAGILADAIEEAIFSVSAQMTGGDVDGPACGVCGVWADSPV